MQNSDKSPKPEALEHRLRPPWAEPTFQYLEWLTMPLALAFVWGMNISCGVLLYTHAQFADTD